jgi:DNA-binding response OmpR family regulator
MWPRVVRASPTIAVVAELGLKRVDLQQLLSYGRDTRQVKERARVVVIEDEAAVRTGVGAALEREGLAVSAFADSVEVEAIEATMPDLIVLDVGLPRGDGFELARQLRARGDVPIVFLTARDAVADRLTGFEIGADDYLIKPFALEELLARVRVVLRRSGRHTAPLEAGDVLVDEQAGLAFRNGQPLALTPTELRLLAFLVRHRGLVLSKPQLLSQVWGYDAFDPNVVEVHISALRRKLEASGPRVLETIRGLGYRLVVR